MVCPQQWVSELSPQTDYPLDSEDVLSKMQRMTKTNPLPPGAQEATPLLAVLLSQILELRATSEAHGALLCGLLERSEGKSGAEALAILQSLLQSARAKVYQAVEGTIRDQFPNHLPTFQVFLRN